MFEDIESIESFKSSYHSFPISKQIINSQSENEIITENNVLKCNMSVNILEIIYSRVGSYSLSNFLISQGMSNKLKLYYTRKKNK